MTEKSILPKHIDTELLPCPHCRRTDLFTERADFTSSYVVCNTCGARGPTMCQDDDGEDEPGQAAAIARWNTRALEAARSPTSPTDGDAEWLLHFARDIRGDLFPGDKERLEAIANRLSTIPTSPREGGAPIPMLLYCPQCGSQHIDEPDARTPDWTNPPHKSHLCHECGCIWRPADVPTEGVDAIATKGKADTWLPSPQAMPVSKPVTEANGMREALTIAKRDLQMLANWRKDSAACTDGMGQPRRKMDEAQVIHMESEAARSLREIDAALLVRAG